MTRLDRDIAEDAYLRAVSEKERAEIKATEAWLAYASIGLDPAERVAACRAWMDALSAITCAEKDVRAAWKVWQAIEKEATS